MARTIYRTCNLCEAMCGLALTVDGDRITEVRGDEEDVFSRGHICPKGPALREVYEDPDRVRRPLRRNKNGWEEISWKSALDETAERLLHVRAQHGRDSLALYIGNPSVHNHGASLALWGFASALRTRNRFDANSLDTNPKLFACLQMYGDFFAIPIPDVDRTDHFLMFGANPAASNGSLMTMGDVKGRLQDIRKRGGKIVLIDPRRSETAAWSDEHHFVRPAGDAALLLALHHVIAAENLYDKNAVASARGWETLRQIVAPFTPQRVADTVGIQAEAIAKMAREFAGAKRAVAYGRVGACVNQFGTVTSWLIDALNVVTGNFDREGGVMFPTPAVDLTTLGRHLVGNHFGRWRSRVRGMPELFGQLPASTMAEEMETPGEGQIRAMVTLAGNPVLSVPNGPRISAALAKLDFMVSVDYYLNETTRHAHIILPPSHALERGHYDVVFHAIAVRNTTKYSEPVFTPAYETHDDGWILFELSQRMGGMKIGHKAIDAAARALWKVGVGFDADRLIDLAIRLGPYGDKFNPLSKGLNLKKVREAPHGIDLGPMKPGKRLNTPDGRVDLAPKPIADDVVRVEKWLAQPREELVLIGRRHLRSNNSWMHNCRSLVKGPDRTDLLIHPEDLKARGLTDGARVKVKSRVGELVVKARASDEVMRGVVSLPHGWGHAEAKETMKVAGQAGGGQGGPNVNALTDDMLLEPLTGTAVLNGVPVSVELV